MLNLARVAQYNVNNENSVEFIEKVHTCFSGKSIWYKYQEEAAAYLQDTSKDHEELFASITEIYANCEQLCGDIISAVRKINNLNKALNSDAAKSAAPVS